MAGTTLDGDLWVYKLYCSKQKWSADSKNEIVQETYEMKKLQGEEDEDDEEDESSSDDEEVDIEKLAQEVEKGLLETTKLIQAQVH